MAHIRQKIPFCPAGSFRLNLQRFLFSCILLFFPGILLHSPFVNHDIRADHRNTNNQYHYKYQHIFI
ncbi:MAG: NAD(P)H-quinone oxidoreductase subunit L [Lachnospiraceae bacterium]|nr:NAD(P)H-quinone oxidoreductase subunit L [Lachnospiraceae bacterium]